jgi:translation initiation factor 6
VIFIK